MNTDQQFVSGARIIADLLDLRDDSKIGATIARRINHLGAREGRLVLAQALGIAALILEQVRTQSTSGADVLTQIRDGLTTDIVANNLLKGDQDGN